ncbi:hypothetical protein M405DRAFT_425554 [Rhizopogon salebrosus TDB-379]|nr:hypothetical protein M405DRAFT_425554 [Rhizopogon salebrosus TDB-379]
MSAEPIITPNPISTNASTTSITHLSTALKRQLHISVFHCTYHHYHCAQLAQVIGYPASIPSMDAYGVFSDLASSGIELVSAIGRFQLVRDWDPGDVEKLENMNQM